MFSFFAMLQGIGDYIGNIIRVIHPFEQSSSRNAVLNADNRAIFPCDYDDFPPLILPSTSENFDSKKFGNRFGSLKMKMKRRSRWSFRESSKNISTDLELQPRPTALVRSLTDLHNFRSSDFTDSKTCSGGSSIPIEDKSSLHGHHFCPIPLEGDTFCDFCSKPVYGLGWGPVCQRCADCHMTCHWSCTAKVQIGCQHLLQEKMSAANDSDSSGLGDSVPKSNGDDSDAATMQEKVVGEVTDRMATCDLACEYPIRNVTEKVDHPLSMEQLCNINGTSDSTLLCGNEILSEQVVHGSFLTKTAEQKLALPNKLHRYSHPSSQKDALAAVPDEDDAVRRLSECSLFKDTGVHNEHELCSPNRTVYYTASSHLLEDGRDDFDRAGSVWNPLESADIPKQNTPSSKAPPYGRGPVLQPATSLARRKTDLDRLRKPKRTKLVARHSFLAGHGSDASIYSRLSYDFSSLDQESILAHGIRVHELSPTNQLERSPPPPPPPPQRVSSLVKSTECSPVHHAPLLSQRSVPELGLASVMQTTEAFIRNKAKKRTKPKLSFSPPNPVPLHPVVIGPRDYLPYSIEQLAERLTVFNSNEYGLRAESLSCSNPGDCEGQIRIHINLLRPIRMLLNVRPVSIFDVIGKDKDETTADFDEDELSWDSHASTDQVKAAGITSTSDSQQHGPTHYEPPKSAVTSNAPTFSADYQAPVPPPIGVQRRFSKRLAGSQPQSTTFWVPRGSTKLLHVQLSTTTHQVISALLKRFQIEDEPQKFALYEHTIEGDQEVSVRKLFDNESPLGLLLRWTERGVRSFNQLLCIKRLVLQENETGDIEWSGFSLPELNTFLTILHQEEADYRRRIELKFELRRKEILRLMALHEERNAASNKARNMNALTTFGSPKPGDRTSVIVEENESADTAVDKTVACDAQSGSQSAVNEYLTIPSSSILPAEEIPVVTPIPDDMERDRLPDPSLTIRRDNLPRPSDNESNLLSNAVSTLPRVANPQQKMKSSFFRKSHPLQIKRSSERAQQKRLAKLEEERIKAEKRRLKAEPKLLQPTRIRRWLGLPGLPASPPAPSKSASVEPGPTVKP